MFSDAEHTSWVLSVRMFVLKVYSSTFCSLRMISNWLLCTGSYVDSVRDGKPRFVPSLVRIFILLFKKCFLRQDDFAIYYFNNKICPEIAMIPYGMADICFVMLSICSDGRELNINKIKYTLFVNIDDCKHNILPVLLFGILMRRCQISAASPKTLVAAF